MRRLGFILSLFIWVVLSENVTNNVKLRVSVRSDALTEVSAGIQSFSQVELLNLHSQDSMTIHSIEMEPELTYLVKNGERVNLAPEALPKQLHLSRLPNGSLTLGPKQIAIVPITFIPRYPQQQPTVEADSHNDSAHYDSNAPRLSSASYADLEKLVGHENLDLTPKEVRNNLGIGFTGDVYEVHTTLVLETTRGPVRLDFVASSLRRNSYRLPEVIRFRQPLSNEAAIRQLVKERETTKTTRIRPMSHEVMILDVENANGEREDPELRKAKALTAKATKNDCYDLYISNPSNESQLTITELKVSRPDLAGLYYADGANPDTTLHHKVSDKMRILGPNTKESYMATVCSGASTEESKAKTGTGNDLGLWLNSNDDSMRLGYLTIQTDKDKIFVGLQSFEDDSEDDTSGLWAGTGMATPYVIGGPTSLGDCRADLNETKQMAVQGPVDEGGSMLVADPPQVVEQLIVDALGKELKTSAFIKVKSLTSFPVRIMRATLVADTPSPDFAQMLSDLGLKLNVTVLDPYDGVLEENCSNCDNDDLDLDEINEKEIGFHCRLSGTDAESYFGSSDRTGYVRVTGHIIARATAHVDKKYEDWIDLMRLDPFEERHLTVEIPYSVTIQDGRVELVIDSSENAAPEWRLETPVEGSTDLKSVQGLFFPFRPRSRESNGENNNKISYDIRVVSLGSLPLELGKVSVVDVGEGQNAGPVCESFRPRGSPVLWEGDATSDSTLDIGTVNLVYDPTVKSKQIGLLDKTVECRLMISVGHASGSFPTQNVTLLVYPGTLSITTAEPIDVDPGRLDFSTPLIDGFDSLVKWMDSSPRLGAGLKRHLDNNYKKNDYARLLRFYLEDMIELHGPKDWSILRPLLLEVGSVIHPDPETVPLYFRNLNPVPITVYLDTAEVEGMAIILDRDELRNPRDGRLLRDYFPVGDDSIVEEGPWKGHSRAGLRQFLLSNEDAEMLLQQQMPLREAIKLDPSIAHDDVLMRSLYQKYEVAGFHEVPFPFHMYQITETCDSAGHHPPMFNDEELPFKYGEEPVVISDHEPIQTRPVGVCRDREAPDSEIVKRHEPVVIPPGGMARFSARVRTLPEDYLIPNPTPITPYLTTGLILSTDQGEVLPILASYDAVYGAILFSAESLLDKRHRKLDEHEYIDVPAAILADDSTSDGAVDLNDNNWAPWTFIGRFGDSRSIAGAKKIEACNPWFQVSIHDHVDSLDELGRIRTSISCDFFAMSSAGVVRRPEGDVPEYPSFFECAFTWINKRSTLQSRECGGGWIPYDGAIYQRREENEIGADIEDAIDEARPAFVAALETAIKQRESYRSHRKGSDSVSKQVSVSQQQRTDGAPSTGAELSSRGYVPPSRLVRYAEGINMWQKLDEINLNVLRSSVRVTIDVWVDIGTGDKENLYPAHEDFEVVLNDVTLQSQMKIPELVDKERIFNVGENDVRILDFPPTRVADVAALGVPIRNPTAYPVRAKLTAAMSVGDMMTEEHLGEDNKRALNTVNRFLLGYDGAYIQGASETNSLWWEDEGAFFLPDDNGHLSQANYKRTPLTVNGASVSYLPPDLSGTSAFLVGDDSKNYRNVNGKKGRFGASASDDLGETRSTTGDENAANLSPRPFAIPFSATDEIIVPPFSTVELGPILFRPPSQLQRHRCPQSDCESAFFESLVLIENSLTGLERLVLRGRGVWEQVAFLDPDSLHSEDDESSCLENRNGFSALLFSGSSDSSNKDYHQASPVIKEVIVHNAGELEVEFEKVYFSRESHGRKRAGSEAPYSTDDSSWADAGCAVHDFQLSDCFDGSADRHAVNLRDGFALNPGENRSIFVQHFPDCSRRSQFATLTFAYRKQTGSSQHSDSRFDSRLRPGRASLNPTPFMPRDLDLLIGFEMSDEEFANCIPIDGRRLFSFASHGRSRNETTADTSMKSVSYWGSQPSLVGYATVICALILLIYALGAERDARHKSSSEFFWIYKESVRALTSKVDVSPPVSSPEYTNWPAAFRCLARADPSASELQALGREQARQVVAQRYKGEGMLSPQFITSTGVFQRDRTMSSTGARNSKNGSGGNEKVMTLSDAVFGDCLAEDNEGLMSCNLGWRAARSRGVAGKSPRARRRRLKSIRLLEERELAAEEAMRRAVVEEESYEGEMDEVSTAEERDTSTEISDERKNAEELNGHGNAESAEDEIEDSKDVISTSDSEGTARTASKEDEASVPVESPNLSKSKMDRVPSSPAGSTSSNTTRSSTVAATPISNKRGVGDEGLVEKDGDGWISTSKKSEASKSSPQTEKKGKEKQESPKEKKLKPASIPVKTAASPKALVKEDVAKIPKAGKEEGAEVVEKKATTAPIETKVPATEKKPTDTKAKDKTPRKVTAKTPKKSAAAKPKVSSPAPSSTKSISSSPGSIKSTSSSPVAVSQVSAPSKSNPKKEPVGSPSQSSNLRPPPGLAPPPGLIGVSSPKSATTPKAAAKKDKKPKDEDLPPLPFSRDAQLPPLSSSPVATPMSPRPVASLGGVPLMSSPNTTIGRSGSYDEPLSPPPLASSGNSFNVMDFLDSILEDRNASHEEGPGELVSESNATKLPPTIPVLSDDPWAAERKSRASMYGISVEDDDDDDEEDIVHAVWAASPVAAAYSSHHSSSQSSSLSASIPLLTPAAILGLGGDDEDGPDTGGGGKTSFYASLLRE